MCSVDCSSVFFFKQKTAYEMRISDWSSDVCSSDLLGGHRPAAGDRAAEIAGDDLAEPDRVLHRQRLVEAVGGAHLGLLLGAEIGRASCREECVSTCRSRWSPYL